jgi:hypothetical protein
MLDPKEEQQYTELRKLAQKLHIPIPEAFLELEVRDKDGKVIQRHRQRSHSWVRNAYNLMFSNLAGKNGNDATFGAGKLNIKAADGTIKYGDRPIFIGQQYSTTIEGTGAGGGYRAANADGSHGILVGSGINAESFEDYALQTQIVEGTGAGQLSHILSEAHSMSYAALTLKNTLSRYFNNNSGGDVSVNEVALYTLGGAGGGTSYWCTSRDHLASTVTVPNTGQLKVTYIIQLTYPS